MARKKWYDAAGIDSVRVVPQPGSTLHGPSRRRRPRTAPRLGECLLYPWVDGPGVALLVFLAPVLLLLTLPVFDLVAVLKPTTRGGWELGLLVIPIFSPIVITFSLVFGYGLLVLGQMFVASALGEPDHPRWPEWDSNQIAEGLTRWVWAGLFGVVAGTLPVAAYWVVCGDVDWFDRVVFADLVILAAGYALMALAAALLHDSLVMANPFTVLGAIAQIGWDFVAPCVAGGICLMILGGLMYAIFNVIVSLKLAVAALWVFWVLFLYLAMVVLRMVGLTYYAHADQLVWFKGRPKWGTPSRFGKIYQNS